MSIQNDFHTPLIKYCWMLALLLAFHIRVRLMLHFFVAPTTNAYGASIIISSVVRYEGLVLSVGGNGRSYVLILEAGPSADTTQSKLYFARFSTKVGFCRVRIFYLFVNNGCVP